MTTRVRIGIILAAILVPAAIVRLWDIGSYFPVFWDEAKYLREVEGLAEPFGVNVIPFAFLRWGHLLLAGTFYPQAVTGIFGLATVIGCFFLGRRLLPKSKPGLFLPILLAAHAAVMPYFLTYSRSALAAGFALCFMVFALIFYLRKLQYPRIKNKRDQIFSARADFFISPYYYLEDLYSWESYWITVHLLRKARDSLKIFEINAAKMGRQSGP